MGPPVGTFHFSPRPNRANEVQWREWGEAAFAEAAAADRPVLLGISAVWCHWCHVMDETSYSDGEVIRLANERFIPIRVDNDERPDVNRRYNMGGWPTTAFLMPDGEPIHGGTYIPPEQLRHLLEEIADLWSEQRDELVTRAAALRSKEAQAKVLAPGDLSAEIVDAVGGVIRSQYDSEFGGFGRQQKFPQPRLLRFLLDEFRRHGHPAAAAMLQKTLGAMAGGGMYDHVEGGFFRYSTDRQWAVPHFEKMLEDNSELLALYAEAHRTFPEAGYDRILRDVMRWMDAVLWRESGAGGAFAGSQDADEHFFALDASERAKHDAPYVDRTVYTSWNALAATAYLAAAHALDDAKPRERAIAVLRTLAGRMRAADGMLFHYDRGQGPELADLLSDHAALLTALLDAYESDASPEALDAAVALAVRLEERLGDPLMGAWWDAPARDAPGRLAKREKPIEDGAVVAGAFLRLAALTGDDRWRERAVRGLRLFVGEYRQWGQFAAAYAGVVASTLGQPIAATVVGPRGDSVADALWRVTQASDDPQLLACQRLDPDRDGARIAALGFPIERTAAYVCVGTACSAPLRTGPDLAAELGRARPRTE